MADKKINIKLKKEPSKANVEKKAKGEKKQLNVAELKKYFNQKTFYGITGVGVAVIALLYVFVYLDYSERTETIKASNTSLQAEVNKLQEYSDNMPTYQSEINEMQTAIEEILSEYPAGAKEEDILMLAVKMQEENQIGYSAINMDDTEEIYAIPASEVTLASIDGMEGDLVFAGKRASYVVTTTYDDLKSVIGQIFASSNRIGINDIVLSKNEDEGTLSGNVDLYFYSALGTGKEYIVPDIAEYMAGTGDIFNSGKVKTSSEESQSSEGETANENGEGQ